MDCHFDQGACEWLQDKDDDIDWSVAYHENGKYDPQTSVTSEVPGCSTNMEQYGHPHHQSIQNLDSFHLLRSGILHVSQWPARGKEGHGQAEATAQ